MSFLVEELEMISRNLPKPKITIPLLSFACLYSEHSESFHIIGAQELDKRWKISTETAIKAKSMRGYATYTRYATYHTPSKPGVSHFF